MSMETMPDSRHGDACLLTVLSAAELRALALWFDRRVVRGRVTIGLNEDTSLARQAAEAALVRLGWYEVLGQPGTWRSRR